MKPKVRQLTDPEQEVLAECFFNTYSESVFVDQPMADKLYETLLEGGRIWVEVKSDMESPQNEAQNALRRVLPACTCDGEPGINMFCLVHG